MGESSSDSSADTLRDDAEAPRAAQKFGLIALFGPQPELRGLVATLDRAPIQIGRRVRSGDGIRVHDGRVSKIQAEIGPSPVDHRYWIRDLGSANGTYVNGLRIDRRALHDGDLIRLGDTLFRFAEIAPELTGAPVTAPELVGRSPGLQRTLSRARRVAKTGSPVLILGETGVGKELVAAAIHRESGRGGPLRAVNCAALASELAEGELFGHVKGAFTGAETHSAGLFRSAEGGTLFLDEVGELAPAMQAKLLRALNDLRIRPVGGAAEIAVDVRVIAATNRDLASAARSGAFRPDLYARLAEVTVAIDPLRERVEDLEPLWNHFIEELGSGQSFELKGATFEAMALYGWPLNAREVRHLARHALLVKPGGGALWPSDLPPAMQRATDAAAALGHGATPPAQPSNQAPSAETLRRLVEELGGNVREVAAFVGKDRTQIYRWLKRYGIDPAAYRDR